jgi:WD40 repeat protein
MSADDKVLAVATDNGWLAIWVTSGTSPGIGSKLEEWQLLGEKAVLHEGFNCLTFAGSGDGEELAAAGSDRLVRSWRTTKLRNSRLTLDDLERKKQSTRDDQELKKLEDQIAKLKSDAIDRGTNSLPVEHGGPITCMAFSSDGHTFASGSSDLTIKVWRLGEGGNQRKGVVSPDGKLVATVEPQAIRVMGSGRVNNFSTDPNYYVRSMTFSADSKEITVRFKDRSSRFEPESVGLYYPSEDSGITIPAAEYPAISPNGLLVAAKDAEAGTIRVLDIPTGRVRYLFPTNSAETKAKIGLMIFSPDGSMLAVGRSDSSAHVYYMEKGEELEIPATQGGRIETFTRDSRVLTLVARAGRSPQKNRWDVVERRRLAPGEQVPEGPPDPGQSAVMARAASGDLVATAEGQRITLSDGKTWRAIPAAHRLLVTSLAFAPDGSTLVSGSFDGEFRLWDAKSLKPRSQAIPISNKRISSLAFSPDGRRLALSDGDQTILWDLSAGQELLSIPNSGLAEAAAFSSDGMALGSRNLGAIFLRAPYAEPGIVTNIPAKSGGNSEHPFTWLNHRDGVAILAPGPGYDRGTPLHICRLSYKDKWYVGSTSGGDCQVGLQGRRLSFGIYEVLVKADAALWLVDEEVESKEGRRPISKLIAGKQDGKDVAICRATSGDGLYIGWTVGEACHTAVDDDEIEIPAGRYQVAHARR